MNNKFTLNHKKLIITCHNCSRVIEYDVVFTKKGDASSIELVNCRAKCNCKSRIVSILALISECKLNLRLRKIMIGKIINNYNQYTTWEYLPDKK